MNLFRTFGRGKQPVVARSASPPRHRLVRPDAFADVIQPLVGRRVGYVRPRGNVGDALIEVAMTQLFASYGVSWKTVEPDRRESLDGIDVLCFGGGGSMGTRYAANHDLRSRALATGLPVWILPQSFTGPENRPYARVFVRERASQG